MPEETAILITAVVQGLVSRWALGNYSFNLEQQYFALWKSCSGHHRQRSEAKLAPPGASVELPSDEAVDCCHPRSLFSYPN